MPTADHDSDALDVLDTSFRLLVTGPSPLAIDGAALGHGLPARLIPLDQLRALLLDRGTPYAARDAAVRELLCRARRSGGAWTVGLAGVLAPGLRRVAAALANEYPGDPADIDAEVLAGLLDGIARIDPAGGRLPARLLRHAFNRAKRLRRAEVWLAARSVPVPPDSMAPPRLVGHPDLVLARAVRRQVITRDEAELIGMTRLEGIGIAPLAAANGYQLGALYLRRERAEARLVGWLTTGRLPARRAWSRPIRLCWPAVAPPPGSTAPHAAAGGQVRTAPGAWAPNTQPQAGRFGPRPGHGRRKGPDDPPEDDLPEPGPAPPVPPPPACRRAPPRPARPGGQPSRFSGPPC